MSKHHTETTPTFLKHILVVDDEDIIRKSCDLVLSRAGYYVETVENGIKALQSLSKVEFDIVLLDLKMPLMDGFELLKTINRDFPHLQAIIMTGYATVENAINAMKEGAYDFVLKPFRSDQLRVVVDRCAQNIDLNSEISELKLANAKLRELQDMKDKFIAITSHELRTPVSHIKGYLSILNDNSYPEISEEDKLEFMKIINSALSDLENIVHTMFDVLQIESGHFKLNIEKFSIDKLIERVVNDFQIIVMQRNLNVITNELNVDVEVEGDRSKIKHVISELLQNAIKFTPNYGTIQITSGVQDDYYVINVIDNGVGIKESELGKIFEKFYEVQNADYHSSSKTNFMGGGIGLGLSIVKAIVESHHGRVVVESKYGTGTQFKVMLPRTITNYK